MSLYDSFDYMTKQRNIIWLGPTGCGKTGLATGFLLQAIDALRPKHFRPKFGKWVDERPDHPRGVRYYEDVVLRDTEAHWQAWREVSVQQLNAELAVQLHSLCLKNDARKMALRRLYHSLRVMTIVFSAILLLFGIFIFI